MAGGETAEPASEATSSGFKSMRTALGEASADPKAAPSIRDLVLTPRSAEHEAERERRRQETQRGAEAAAAYFRALAKLEDPPDRPQPEPPSDGLPACATCHGRRFLRPDVHHDDPRFGKIVRCPACLASPDAGPELRGRAGRAAGLAEAQLCNTFGSFKPSAAAMEAFRVVRDWAELPKGWVVLFGEPGCGKSHLAAAAVNRLLELGLEVLYRYTPDLMDAVRESIDQGGEAHHWLLRSLKSQPILVLDDLGAGARTEYAVEVLEKLLDYRYREFLPTLICLIGSPDEVKAHLSESIGRRMQDPRISRVVENKAPQWGAP